MTPRILLVTNYFPPYVGGIQQYCYDLARRLPSDRVAVYAPAWPGAETFDAAQEFAITRHPTNALHPPALASSSLPYRDVINYVNDVVKGFHPNIVCFGATFPLGLLARELSRSFDIPCVGFTHGLEVAALRVPHKRELLLRIATDVRLLTAVSHWSAALLKEAVGSRCQIELLPGGVSTDVYHPGVEGHVVRERYSLTDAPVCVCVGRLVPRKGQDCLIQAWPDVVARVPHAQLLLVGEGRYGEQLRRMAASSPVARHIHFTGEVSSTELPAYYAAGDVFAMPCRTRQQGLDMEAFGLVFLEAAATGLPVVVGRSGGSSETVVDGTTGMVVDGRSSASVARSVGELLHDRSLARKMGAAGRKRVQENFSWEAISIRLKRLLAAVLE